MRLRCVCCAWSRIRGTPSAEKVGGFGVGFYSVFQYTQRPIVASRGVRMRFFWNGDELAVNKTNIADERGGEVAPHEARTVGAAASGSVFTLPLSDAEHMLSEVGKPQVRADAENAPRSKLLCSNQCWKPANTWWSQFLCGPSPQESVQLARMTPTAHLERRMCCRATIAVRGVPRPRARLHGQCDCDIGRRPRAGLRARLEAHGAGRGPAQSILG